MFYGHLDYTRLALRASLRTQNLGSEARADKLKRTDRTPSIFHRLRDRNLTFFFPLQSYQHFIQKVRFLL